VKWLEVRSDKSCSIWACSTHSSYDLVGQRDSSFCSISVSAWCLPFSETVDADARAKFRRTCMSIPLEQSHQFDMLALFNSAAEAPEMTGGLGILHDRNYNKAEHSDRLQSASRIVRPFLRLKGSTCSNGCRSKIMANEIYELWQSTFPPYKKRLLTVRPLAYMLCGGVTHVVAFRVWWLRLSLGGWSAICGMICFSRVKDVMRRNKAV
jgi:hypothetical protein